eukprot:183948-Pyramimonas_sp.AAC.1
MCTCGAAGVHMHTRDSRCAQVGQPMCTRGTADVHKWGSRCAHTRGSRCAHAGQPMYICVMAADAHTRGSRCAQVGQPMCTHAGQLVAVVPGLKTPNTVTFTVGPYGVNWTVVLC